LSFAADKLEAKVSGKLPQPLEQEEKPMKKSGNVFKDAAQAAESKRARNSEPPAEENKDEG